MSVASKAIAPLTRAAKRLLAGGHMGARAFQKSVAVAEASLPATANAIKSLLTKDKAKFVAGLVAYGLVDEGIDEIFTLLSEDSDPAVHGAIEEARAQIEEYRTAAGVDVTPEEDGVVANHSAEIMTSNVAMYLTAKQYFDDAARAVGGKHRLLAIMHWLSVDDDLKQMVINNEVTY